MKRYTCSAWYFAVCLLLCSTGCKKDESDTEQAIPPYTNISGYWYSIETITGNCQGQSYPLTEYKTFLIQQDGNNVKLYFNRADYIEGTINDKNLEWSFEYPSGNGTVHVKFSGELGADSVSYTGTSEWTYNHGIGDYTCSGTADYMGYKINNQTTITSITATPTTIHPGESSTLTCLAADGQWDAIKYTWNAANDAITGTGSSVTWSCEQTGVYDVWCYVTDEKGNFDSASVKITVSEKIKPPSRYAHKIAYLPDSNQVLLFGGVNSALRTSLNDSWIYDIASHTWRELHFNSNVPDPVGHGALCYIGGGECIAFGGSDQYDNYNNDTWIYNHAAKTWSELSISGDIPTAREAHSMDYIGGDNVILFAGVAGGNSTWRFDRSEHTWTNYAVTGDWPVARFGHDHTVFIESTHELYMFGGAIDSLDIARDVNDLWTFNTNDNVWSEISTSGDIPPRRRHLAMAYGGNDNLFSYGGISWEYGTDNSMVRDDLWEFNVTTREWTQLSASGDLPPALQAFDMVYIGNNRILLYSGNEVYVLNTLTHIWTLW